ncbi:MAG: hypothetical protein EOP16_02515 [Pseudonocardia sp.]|nr:MAG: hypothetical protein EOP16_02515 [Pseudonocardia sp.]
MDGSGGMPADQRVCSVARRGLKAECEELLKHAYGGAKFAEAVFSKSLEIVAFPQGTLHLELLHGLAVKISELLESIVVENGWPIDRPHAEVGAIEYLTTFRMLGWTEFMVAASTFGQAALLRLQRLKAIAPDTQRPRVRALIAAEATALTVVVGCATSIVLHPHVRGQFAGDCRTGEPHGIHTEAASVSACPRQLLRWR